MLNPTERQRLITQAGQGMKYAQKVLQAHGLNWEQQEQQPNYIELPPSYFYVQQQKKAGRLK